MRRRQSLGWVGSLALLPHAYSAGTTRRIGFLGGVAPDASVRRIMIDPFESALRERGYMLGSDLIVDYRWAAGRPDRLPGLLGELLRLEPDLLVAAGPRPAIVAKTAPRTLPVVAAAVDNPVAMGLAETYARPGANITGISSFGIELVAKRLQLLKDLVPAARRLAVLMNPATSSRQGLEPHRPGYEKALAVTVQVVQATGAEQFDAAFTALERERAQGLVVLADATFYTHRARLAELCTQYRLPSVWGGRDYLQGGGLASYQSDFAAIFARAAVLADQILKGARPAEMPFEQATKLELVVNLQAARALGITVPQALLASADEVIE